MTREAQSEPFTIEAMDDTELVLHYKALGWNPDALGYVKETDAARSLVVSQKHISRWRENDYFDEGECRRIAGNWRYLIRALVRVHAEHG